MSIIGDTSYHLFITGETVDANGSPTGADLNVIFKIFQAAINDNYDRIININTTTIPAPEVDGIDGDTINEQIVSIAGFIQALPWANLISVPTTLSGYGITDSAAIDHAHGIGIGVLGFGDVLGTLTLGEGGSADNLGMLTLRAISTAGTYTKVTIDTKGRVTSGTTLSAADIPSLLLSKISDAGSAASKTAGNAVGNVPMVESGGKLNASIIPVTTITDVFVVDSEAEMLALDGTVGDVAKRTDGDAETFILQALPATDIANWLVISTGSAVDSVAGKTGTVTLVKGDVGLGNVDNESKATMFTDSTFTGDTTGENWVGRWNGILFTVSATAPVTPTEDDIWVDLTTQTIQCFDGEEWFPVGGSGDSESGTGGVVIATALPTATSSFHGKMYQISIEGAEDVVYTCIKLDDETYEWRQVFATDSAVLRAPNGNMWTLDVTNDGRLTTHLVE